MGLGGFWDGEMRYSLLIVLASVVALACDSAVGLDEGNRPVSYELLGYKGGSVPRIEGPIGNTASDSSECYEVVSGGHLSFDPSESTWAVAIFRWNSCDGALRSPPQAGSYTNIRDSIYLSVNGRRGATVIRSGDTLLLQEPSATFSAPRSFSSTPEGRYKLAEARSPEFTNMTNAVWECSPDLVHGELYLDRSSGQNEVVVGRFSTGTFRLNVSLADGCSGESIAVTDSGTFGQVARTLMFAGAQSSYPGRVRTNGVDVALRSLPWLRFEPED